MDTNKNTGSKSEPLSVQLLRIRNDRFNLTPMSELLENYKENILIDPDSLVYDFKTRFHFQPDYNIILCVFTVNVRIKDAYKTIKRKKKSGFQVASMDVQYDFEINDLHRFINNDGSVTLPDILIITINSIALSTTRGIWFEKSSSTYLGGRVLHIIDPKSFKQDISDK